MVAVGRNGPLAALDIGTTKVCCFVARQDAGALRVTGIGHQVSHGLRAGAITDMEAAEESIRAAVDAAERMAGETIREVVVSLSGGQPVSHTVGVEVAIAGHEVGDSDLRRVMDQARARQEPGDREVIHALPVGYTIDGSRGIRDPRGMYGERLGVNMHVVTAQTGALRNLAICIERCHLQVADIAVAPYVSGLACLVEDEMDLGVTVIEMGGGTTSLAIFYDGAVVHTDVIPIGGTHVTSDIARGLATTTAHAERLKTLYGSAIPSPSDEKELVDVPLIGEQDDDVANHVPRSMLVGIVKPRIEETLELVRDRLITSGLEKAAGRRVVLTGGASQLAGVRELAARMLDKQVRLGKPIRIKGLADATGGPAFAACAGLLSYATMEQRDATPRRLRDESAATGTFGRLGRWLKQNF
ncbi:cell division protein FtsA [Oceanibacterium hippocampi]|uniref:Cell division protein FtsA n=1 Tax=Oceanibacterium hippocampi TaxID=745714 RepID=A0A1Y5SD82_9PROT|nr:cell division protein FtsA [Oceanibacterium hippocampi]SLN37352.1 Cell division protein FtsA [Oceanibacterium hippocampi]